MYCRDYACGVCKRCEREKLTRQLQSSPYYEALASEKYFGENNGKFESRRRELDEEQKRREDMEKYW